MGRVVEGKVGREGSERENRILILLRNTGQSGFPLCGKKEICFQISLLTQCAESGRKERRGPEDRGRERRASEGRREPRFYGVQL